MTVYEGYFKPRNRPVRRSMSRAMVRAESAEQRARRLFEIRDSGGRKPNIDLDKAALGELGFVAAGAFGVAHERDSRHALAHI
jgi:hypothetical protein